MRMGRVTAWGNRVGIPLAVASLLLAACTGGHKVAVTASGPTGGPTPSLPSASLLNPSILAADPTVQVVKRVAPAVVNVTTAVANPGSFFGGPQTGQDIGTGFIIRSDGVIVTNFHVVEGALNIKVTLPPPDGRTFPARVIGGDSDHDVAVLKVDGTNMPTVALGDSAQVQLGERVIALGYALALPGGPTVTSGIISSLARTVQASDPNSPNGSRTYQDALQTDAAINPGNSGGPLVDLAGNVIGINTAGNAQAENVGFSIAIDAVKPIIDQAIEHPKAPVAYIGVSTETVDAGIAAQFALAVDHGALVVTLSPGGPASKTSIQVGDVIVEFAATPIATSDDLAAAIATKKPNDRVNLVVVKADGSRQTVTVTLGVRPLPT